MIYHWFQYIPWNKGKHYESTDHLKVPKTISESFKKARKDVGILKRTQAKRILVFDINYPLILKGKQMNCQLKTQQNLVKQENLIKVYILNMKVVPVLKVISRMKRTKTVKSGMIIPC